MGQVRANLLASFKSSLIDIGGRIKGRIEGWIESLFLDKKGVIWLVKCHCKHLAGRHKGANGLRKGEIGFVRNKELVPGQSGFIAEDANFYFIPAIAIIAESLGL